MKNDDPQIEQIRQMPKKPAPRAPRSKGRQADDLKSAQSADDNSGTPTYG
jgi:hypothetical protein